jgi:hypothetical protein
LEIGDLISIKVNIPFKSTIVQKKAIYPKRKRGRYTVEREPQGGVNLTGEITDNFLYCGTVHRGHILV